MGELLQNRFELQELISDGPAAQVYRAFDRQLGLPVAVKRLVDAAPASRARFIREAQCLRQLSSNHVIDVHELFANATRPFMVMPWLKGETLRRRIRQTGGLTLETCRSILVQLCDGLAKVHAAGLVHRDIKPSNVLLTDDGTAVLIDFGVAWAGVSDPSKPPGAASVKQTKPGRAHAVPLTESQVAVGTPAYMAPEVLRGEARNNQPAVDVYALGVLAHEMLTMQVPGGTPTRLDQLGRAVDAGVSQPFADVIERALAAHPSARYRDASELYAALVESARLDPTAVPSGTILDGRYQVAEKLGEGGMAVVYRALDTRLDRAVALKLLAPDPALTETQQHELSGRFRDEHEMLMRLDHSNVVKILAVSRSEGVDFGVLELLQGISLSNVMNSMSWTEFLDALTQVADALDTCHRHDIVHRDVKPENIMLVGSRAVLVDFGVARLGDRWRTRTGYVVGTPGAEAPEQIEGADVSGATDQWGLAALVYRQLTGSVPGYPSGVDSPTEARMHTIENVQEGAVEPLSKLRPDVSVALTEVVHRALAPNPANRFRTVGEFVYALREAGGELHSPPLGVTRWFGLGMVGLALVGLITALAVSANSPHANVGTKSARTKHLDDTSDHEDLPTGLDTPHLNPDPTLAAPPTLTSNSRERPATGKVRPPQPIVAAPFGTMTQPPPPAPPEIPSEAPNLAPRPMSSDFDETWWQMQGEMDQMEQEIDDLIDQPL